MSKQKTSEVLEPKRCCRATPFMVMPPFFVIIFGVSLDSGVSVFVAEGLLCAHLKNQSFVNQSSCEVRTDISADATFWLGWMSVAQAVLSTIFAGTLGSLTDTYGRKFLLVMASAGQLCYIIVEFAATIFVWPLPVIFVGRAIYGVCGGYVSYLAAAFAYVADTAPKHRRTCLFGILEGTFFAAGAAGPLVGGVLTQKFGTKYATGIELAVVTVGFCWTLAIPNSSTLSGRVKPRRHDCRRHNLFSTLKFLVWPRESDTAQTLSDPKQSKAEDMTKKIPQFSCADICRRGVCGPIAKISYAFFLAVLALFGFSSFAFAYLSTPVYKLSETQMGLFFSCTYGIRGVGVVCGMLLFVHGPPRLRVKELRLVQISSGAALLLSLGVAVSPFMATASQSVVVLLAASSLHLLGGIMIPVIRALISHSTSPDRQGQAITAIASLETIVSIFAPALFSSLYRATALTMGWVSLWVIVAMNAISFLLTMLTRDEKIPRYKEAAQLHDVNESTGGSNTDPLLPQETDTVT